MLKRFASVAILTLAAAGLVPATAHAAPAKPDKLIYSRTVLVHYYSGPDLQTEVGESFWNKCQSWESGQETQWSSTEVTWMWCQFYG